MELGGPQGLDDQLRIMEDDTFQRVEKMLIGKVADGGRAS